MLVQLKPETCSEFHESPAFHWLDTLILLLWLEKASSLNQIQIGL